MSSSVEMKTGGSKVVFLGDCRADGTFGTSLSKVPFLFPDADCFVINLECAVAGSDVIKAKKSRPLLATYQEFSAVVEAFSGHQVVFNIANNHSADAGPQETIRFKEWCKSTGVALVGGGNGFSLVLPCGIRIGIAAGISTSSTEEIASISAWDSPALAELRAEVDVVAFLAHWGEEYVLFPSPDQIQTARSIWKSGADLIVGCHPHVIQGAEHFEGKCVYYSLGNGTMHLPEMQKGSKVGAALVCEFRKEKDYDTRIVPFHISNQGDLKLLSSSAESSFLELFERLSQFQSSWFWWRKQASKVFFINHMGSWMRRIHRHGLIEFLRMCRAISSRPYLQMAGALLACILHRTPNDFFAESLENLDSSKKS